MSLFQNEDILTKEIQSWTAFVDSLHSDNRELSMSMLNGCYKYAAAAINAKGEPFPAEQLIMTLLLSQQKMVDWLTAKEISKHESLVINDNKEEVKKAKQLEEQGLGREDSKDYIRKNKRIHYIDDY